MMSPDEYTSYTNSKSRSSLDFSSSLSYFSALRSSRNAVVATPHTIAEILHVTQGHMGLPTVTATFSDIKSVSESIGAIDVGRLNNDHGVVPFGDWEDDEEDEDEDEEMGEVQRMLAMD